MIAEEMKAIQRILFPYTTIFEIHGNFFFFNKLLLWLWLMYFLLFLMFNYFQMKTKPEKTNM